MESWPAVFTFCIILSVNIVAYQIVMAIFGIARKKFFGNLPNLKFEPVRIIVIIIGNYIGIVEN